MSGDWNRDAASFSGARRPACQCYRFFFDPGFGSASAFIAAVTVRVSAMTADMASFHVWASSKRSGLSGLSQE